MDLLSPFKLIHKILIDLVSPFRLIQKISHGPGSSIQIKSYSSGDFGILSSPRGPLVFAHRGRPKLTRL
jgi:hypothetical protein